VAEKHRLICFWYEILRRNGTLPPLPAAQGNVLNSEGRKHQVDTGADKSVILKVSLED
jgi:hypothetical protein